MAGPALGKHGLSVVNLNGVTINIVQGATYTLIPLTPDMRLILERSGWEWEDPENPYSCVGGSAVYWNETTTLVRVTQTGVAGGDVRCIPLNGDPQSLNYGSQVIAPHHLNFAIRPPTFESAAEAEEWLDAHS